MRWIIGKGIGVPFRLGGSGLGSSYWATRKPSGLTAVVYNGTTVILSWTKGSVEDYDGFKIYVDGVLWDTINIESSYTVSGLTPTTLYTFSVCAYKGASESDLITATATPEEWYLAGGISSANVVGAYSALGASSLATSLVNLNNPGTNDLVMTGAVTHRTAEGWSNFADATNYLTGPAYKDKTYSFIILFKDGVLNADYPRAFSAEPDATGNLGAFCLPLSPAGGFIRQANTATAFANKGTGVFGANQSECFVDGASIGTFTPSGVEHTLAFTIGVHSFHKHNPFNGKILAVVVYDSSITAAQMIAVQNRLLAVPYTVPMRDFTSLTKYVSNPIIPYGDFAWRLDSSDAPYVSKHSKINGEYYAFSQVSAGSWNWDHLALYKSSDLITWTPVGEQPVISVVGDTWEHDWLLHPCIIKIGSTYRAYYTARDNAAKGRLGMATSTDLINWTKYASNPIYEAPSGNVDAISVCKVGKLYYLYYYSDVSSAGSAIKYATSSDGISWTYGGVCWITGTDDWDETEVALDPWVVQRHDGIYEMFYTLYKAGDQRIGYAISFDGINFIKRTTVLLIPVAATWEAALLGNPVSIDMPNGDFYLFYCGAVNTTPEHNAAGLAIIEAT